MLLLIEDLMSASRLCVPKKSAKAPRSENPLKHWRNQQLVRSGPGETYPVLYEMVVRVPARQDRDENRTVKADDPSQIRRGEGLAMLVVDGSPMRNVSKQPGDCLQCFYHGACAYPDGQHRLHHANTIDPEGKGKKKGKGANPGSQ